MDNCDYKILSSNKVGNVLACQDCAEMMIGIGTFILKFKNDQARIFLKALKSTEEEYFIKRNTTIDKVFLKTPVRNLKISLNLEELKGSIELLELAFLQIEIDSLVYSKV